MSTNYWVKLYHEMLDDPKVATLGDRQWRRFVELILLAGKTGTDGKLPGTKQIAWLLRVDANTCADDLKELQEIGVISPVESGWMVTNFSKRQGPIPDAKRQEAMRDRNRSREYHENVTTRDESVKQINRLTDSDTDTDTDPPPPTSSMDDEPLCPEEEQEEEVRMDQDIEDGLHELGVFKTCWPQVKASDWTPAQILALIDQIREDIRTGAINGYKPGAIFMTRLKDKPPLTPEEREARQRRSYTQGPYADFIKHEGIGYTKNALQQEGIMLCLGAFLLAGLFCAFACVVFCVVGTASGRR